MAHYVGKDLYVSFGGTVINAAHRAFDVNRSVDTVDTTAGADTDKSYLATLKDGTMKLTLLDDNTAGTASRRALTVGGTGVLMWGPQGTAVGKPKYGCDAIVTAFSESYPYDGEVQIDIEFQKTGSMTYDYDGSGSTW